MSSNGPFGFDPEEFDRVVREAGEGLRDALDGVSRFFTTSGERAGWATIWQCVSIPAGIWRRMLTSASVL